MNLTDQFIDGLAAKSQSIPPIVTEQAKRCLLDYLGTVIGGMRYVKEKYPDLIAIAPSDAFLHGFAAHVLELDDGHRSGMIHLGASIVSSVLEETKNSGLAFADILRGIVMGYESAVRCAKALQPGHKMRGYHVSGTCGTIGSAIGVAVASGFDKIQLKSTLACAASSAAGLLEIQEQASELKPYNVGRAAMDGIVAARIGRLGIQGPDDILGGERGLLAALTDTAKPDNLCDFSGDEYCIMGIYQKIHASCRHCHPAIDAALDLRKGIDLKPGQVEKIEVHTYKLAVGSHEHTRVRGISSAKLSTPFSVALAIVEGKAGYADYNEENLDDYTINDLSRRVCVIEDEELTQLSPVVRGARLIITLKNGQSFETQCLYPKGEPENPLTLAELEMKFKGLAEYGGLSQQESDILIDAIRDNSFTMAMIKL